MSSLQFNYNSNSSSSSSSSLFLFLLLLAFSRTFSQSESEVDCVFLYICLCVCLCELCLYFSSDNSKIPKEPDAQLSLHHPELSLHLTQWIVRDFHLIPIFFGRESLKLSPCMEIGNFLVFLILKLK